MHTHTHTHRGRRWPAWKRAQRIMQVAAAAAAAAISAGYWSPSVRLTAARPAQTDQSAEWVWMRVTIYARAGQVHKQCLDWDAAGGRGGGDPGRSRRTETASTELHCAQAASLAHWRLLLMPEAPTSSRPGRTSSFLQTAPAAPPHITLTYKANDSQSVGLVWCTVRSPTLLAMSGREGTDKWRRDADRDANV